MATAEVEAFTKPTKTRPEKTGRASEIEDFEEIPLAIFTGYLATQEEIYQSIYGPLSEFQLHQLLDSRKKPYALNPDQIQNGLDLVAIKIGEKIKWIMVDIDLTNEKVTGILAANFPQKHYNLTSTT